jgi:TetR/AcrR family transcriptional regulator
VTTAAKPRSDARDRILDVATRLFAEQGYSGTSVQSVAREAGMRAPSLLYHFASKELLRDAVLDGLLARWKDIVPKVLLAATTGRDRFDGVIGEVVAFFEEEPLRARLLLRESLDRPEEIQALIATHLAPWMSLLTEFIELGKREGRIHQDLDPPAYVSEVVLLILGHFALGGIASAALVEDLKERRLIELRRLCNAALYRPRPELKA